MNILGIDTKYDADIACLKEKDRDIFMELYVEEASIDEISKKHDIKKPVLYSRISRAKKRIRIMEGMKKHE